MCLQPNTMRVPSTADIPSRVRIWDLHGALTVRSLDSQTLRAQTLRAL